MIFFFSVTDQKLQSRRYAKILISWCKNPASKFLVVRKVMSLCYAIMDLEPTISSCFKQSVYHLLQCLIDAELVVSIGPFLRADLALLGVSLSCYACDRRVIFSGGRGQFLLVNLSNIEDGISIQRFLLPSYCTCTIVAG